MKKAFLLFALSLMLESCSKISPKGLDPNNDLHCSILTYYMTGVAIKMNAPSEQIRALRRVQAFYFRKMAEDRSANYSDPNLLKKVSRPIFDDIKSDPSATRIPAEICANRAKMDVSF